MKAPRGRTARAASAIRFLGGRRYAVLATHDPDGGIQPQPIWYLFENDGFYFASSSGSRKVKNVELNFSASIVVDAGEPGREHSAFAAARLACGLCR